MLKVKNLSVKIGNKNMFECNDIVVFPKNDKNLFTKKLNEDTILKNPQSEKTFDVEIPSPIRVNPNSIKQLINKNSNSQSLHWQRIYQYN